MGVRGFALVTVLGFLAVASALGLAILANSRWLVREAGHAATLEGRRSVILSGFSIAAAHALSSSAPAAAMETFETEMPGGTIRGNCLNLAGRVDLNYAPAALLAAAAELGGLDPDEGRVFASRIIDWRDTNTERELGGGPESIDYAGGINPGPRNGLFQSLFELAQIPGATPAQKTVMSGIYTIASGLETVDLRLADPRLFLHVPGILPQTRTAIEQHLASGTRDYGLLEEAILADPVLEPLVSDDPSQGWQVEMDIALAGGGALKVNGTIALLEDDEEPFRVIEFTGPLEDWRAP